MSKNGKSLSDRWWGALDARFKKDVAAREELSPGTQYVVSVWAKWHDEETRALRPARAWTSGDAGQDIPDVTRYSYRALDARLAKPSVVAKK